MKKDRIIFRNSKKYINEGNGFGEGILYCGDKYTNEDGCPCGKCDGHCGTDNGCPCPDCDNTLAYILYSTGKMNCGKCQKTLIRLRVFDLSNIYKRKFNFTCDICKKYYPETKYLPVLHCLKCKYNMCSKCAFSKITPFEPEIPKIEAGFNDGIGMIYCRKNYTHESHSCDGNCGEENGCPCPLCDAILGYNIYLKSNYMRCNHCNNNLKVKTTVGLLKKANVKISSCIRCSYAFKLGKDDFHTIYHCKKCLKNICKKCAFDLNIKDMSNIGYPRMPLFLDKLEKINEEKNEKKEFKNLQIKQQRRFRISTKKEKGKDISIYLKTLIGRIYTIIIDENEDIGKLKEDLRKHDNKFMENNTILIYKNRKLEDYEYLKDLGIENESLINVFLK